MPGWSKHKKLRENVSGKQHPPTGGGDTGVKSRGPGPQAAAARASGKAANASAHAQKVGTASAHEAAYATHANAAVAQNRAGNPEAAASHRTAAEHHQGMANAVQTRQARFVAETHAASGKSGVAARALGNFSSKGFKAEKASEKAMASGKRSDHTAAMHAHTEAAKAANQAGVDKAHALHHQSQASVHSAHVENIKTEAKAKALTQASGTASSRAQAASRGAFGTDPTTGNVQSKAQVLKPLYSGPPTHVKEHPFGKAYQPPPGSGAASQGGHGSSKDQGFHSASGRPRFDAGGRAQANYEAASAHADKASEKAHTTGKSLDHGLAARAHNTASARANTFGDYRAAEAHSQASFEHRQQAQSIRGAERAAERTRNRASISADKKTLAKVHGQPRNIPHPLERGVTTKGAMSGMSTEAAGPHTDASAHAFAQGTKANAKPSLASHSMAAKAHLQAAAHYGTNDSRHAQHLQQAEVHKTHATTHSQRIMKLKKLGPGQKHGAGGRFTGTPGGAK